MKYRFIIIFCFLIKTAWAQPYGNEWIKKDQVYIKVKVSQNGIYQINYSQLQSLGFLNASPDPVKFQLFFQGKEIPIYINGENDHSFDPADYIQFYGKMNDGSLDRILYTNPNDLPNSEVSLFTDEASYFLTISSQAGKRYQSLNLDGNGLVPEPYMIYTASGNYTDEYYAGEYLIADLSLSEYIEGEGYLGQSFGLGTSQECTLNTPYRVNISGFNPYLDFYVAGRSNPNNPYINHHLQVKVGFNSSDFIKKDTTFHGYSIAKSRANLSLSELGDATKVTFSSVDDLNAPSDFQAPAYARITYPRSFDASGLQELDFKINSMNPACLLKFTNTSWQNPILIDTAHAFRYAGTVSGNSVDFIINNPSNKGLFISWDAFIKTPILENITFNLIDPVTFNANMLIITHSSLADASAEYASYKASKGITSLLVNTDELYNQFYYGVHHPQAIRNFARYLLNIAPIKPKHLLLIGKGKEEPRLSLAEDLVPTMGYPASDVAFTSQIIDNNLAPALATGRIPAKTNQEVRDYLEKLKIYDQLPDSMWRKNIIHINGGKNADENDLLINSVNSFAPIAKKDFFGAKIINFYKKVTDPVTDNLTDKIINEINKGVGLLTFFGHGSTVATEVNLGNSTDLNNKTKPLFYLIDGCSVGNAFTAYSMGEQFIFQKDKAAIGWIATSSVGVVSYLTSFTNIFYEKSFHSNFGKSVAENLKETMRSYQQPSDNYNRAHCRQHIFLGDPSIAFYSPQKPDYEIKMQDVSLLTPDVTASTLSFQLKIVIKNNGKALNQNLPVSIKRTLADNSVITYPLQTYNPVFNTDTLYFDVNNEILNSAGNNNFTITVDPQGSIDEFDESNNTAELNYFIPANGITLLAPDEYAIINNQDVTLQIQANNLFTQNGNYEFEIDTIKTFNSSWKKKSGIISGGLFASWHPSLNLEDNKVYYWRAHINSTDNSINQWQTSSFTYINLSPNGWSQAHYQQFDKITFNNTQLNASTKKFTYINTAYSAYINTRGDDVPPVDERLFRNYNGNKISDHDQQFSGICIIAFNAIQPQQTFNYPSPFNNVNSGQFFFDTNIPAELNAMVDYINNIPSGYYVVGYNGTNLSLQNLPLIAKDALKTLGLSVFETIALGEPYAFWGKKGTDPGTAIERTADYSSGIPARSQSFKESNDQLYPWDDGSYLSEKIGPSLNWKTVMFNFSAETNDQLNYSIIGVKNDGSEYPLHTNLTNPVVDLSSIPVNDYPWLRIKTQATDHTNRTLAQLLSWKVLYDPYPEISINPTFKNSFHAAQLQEGDSLKLSLGLSNISKIISGPFDVKYKIIKSDNTQITGLIKNISTLEANQNTDTDFKYPTIGLAGSNILQVSIDFPNHKDKLAFNNQASFPFVVLTDKKDPLVDVFFDGRRIINGETVSPKPTIQISVTDDNKFLLLNDTTTVNVYLKTETDADFKRISFSSNKITLQSGGTSDKNKASYIFNPDLLADGNYILKVRSKDKSGNYITQNDYQIGFEVINESSITHFLPYPNPFTTSMKFVFKITGQHIPDKIKIQIMTSTGKIVREVLKEELGNLNIGNNLSAFTWDGTDQFGDRLANGVYFYQALVENNDKSAIKHRPNSTDSMFKKNFGKIYLMR